MVTYIQHTYYFINAHLFIVWILVYYNIMFNKSDRTKLETAKTYGFSIKYTVGLR